MFAAMKPYAAAAASRRPAAAAVGRRGPRARRCSATGSTDVDGREALASSCISTGRRTSATSSRRTYGPTIAIYRGIADDPDKVAALDAALAELGPGRTSTPTARMEWEYLLVTARRAA